MKYISYNINKNSPGGHICEEGVYRGFCCGSTFKNNNLFRERPESLQIQISSDDFTVTNPLQPRATIYKMCPIYFSIKNISSKFLSKLDNIFLVALCFSDDLKTKETDFNDIWKLH